MEEVKKNVYNMEVIIDKYYYDPQLHDDDLPEGTNNTWVQEDIFRCEVLAESREIAESILEEKLDEIRPKLNKKLLVDIGFTISPVISTVQADFSIEELTIEKLISKSKFLFNNQTCNSNVIVDEDFISIGENKIPIL
jgi:hypothetical protein